MFALCVELPARDDLNQIAVGHEEGDESRHHLVRVGSHQVKMAHETAEGTENHIRAGYDFSSKSRGRKKR